MAEVVPQAVKDDRLGWALTECPKFSGEVHAWFEYGLMAAYGQASATPFGAFSSSQGWVLGYSGGWTWLNASTPATQFVAGLLVDAVAGYSTKGLAGVQLDDHFSQPTELLPGGVATMSEAAAALSATVRESFDGTSMVLGLSPGTLDQALNSFNVDWRSWGVDSSTGGGPLFDEIVPQLYRSTYTSFASLLNETLDNIYPEVRSRRDEATDAFVATLAIGLRLDGTGAPTAWDELKLMLDDVENKSCLSPSLWYSQGAIELYPTQIQAYWGLPGPTVHLSFLPT